jgi:hypothetical protein
LISKGLPFCILPNVSDSIDELIAQLSELASNQLAYLKGDGTSDLTTEYQIIHVLEDIKLNVL